MATVQLLKSPREVAALPWTNAVPNPSKESTAVSNTFEEALVYLTQIAKLAQSVKEQEGESHAMIKQKCWTYAKQLELSDQYLRIAMICVDYLGTMPADKPVMLLFHDNEPLALPCYAKEYLQRESAYFKQLFSGWSKDSKSSVIELPSMSLEVFKRALQQLNCPKFLQKMGLEDSSEMKNLELIEVIQAADFLGLLSASERAINMAIQRISAWDPANIDQIAMAQALIAQSAKYAHHPEISKALQEHMDKVSKNLQRLITKIDSWSSVKEMQDAQKIVDSGIWQQNPALIKAFESYGEKILEAAQDAEDITKILGTLKDWPITKLSLPGKFIIEDHIEQINQFEKLQSLILQDRTEVEHLMALTLHSLTEIQFRRCKNISKKVLEYLSTLSLTSLVFEHCGIKDIHLAKLKTYKIKNLSLIDCPHLTTSSSLSHLRRLSLTSLCLVNCFSEDQDLSGMALLKPMKTLEQLTLGLPYLKTLAFLQDLPLKILKITNFGISEGEDDLFVHYLKDISIEKLILSGDWITESKLYHLEQAKIKELHLEECKKIYRAIKNPVYFTNWLAQPTTKHLGGHAHPITQLIRLKDGTLASASQQDGMIMLWNKNGSCIKRIDVREHSGLPSGISFQIGGLNDGNLVACIFSSKRISLQFWNQEGTCVNAQHLKYTASEKYNEPDKIIIEGVDYWSDMYYLPPNKIGFKKLSTSGAVLSAEWIVGEDRYNRSFIINDSKNKPLVMENVQELVQLKNGTLATLSASKKGAYYVELWKKSDSKYVSFKSLGIEVRDYRIGASNLTALNDGGFSVRQQVYDQHYYHIRWDETGRPLTSFECDGGFIDRRYGVYVCGKQDSRIIRNGEWKSKERLLQMDDKYGDALQVEDNLLATITGNTITLVEFPCRVWGNPTS